LITPSISFDNTKVLPLWGYLSLEDVQGMICNDVAELRRLAELQAEAESKGIKDYRLRSHIAAWEHAQDTHWSWYKEILNARTAAAQEPEGLGQAVVGSGN
jgi:hypothetical protein